jgi:hypothetical protein
MAFMHWGTIIANAMAGAALIISLVVALRQYRAGRTAKGHANIEIALTPDVPAIHPGSLIVGNSGQHNAQDIKVDIVSATDLPAPRIEDFPDGFIQIASLAPGHVEEFPIWTTGASDKVKARLRWIDGNGRQETNVQAFL